MNLQMIHVWAIPASKYFLMEKSCVSSQRVTISPVLVGPSAKFHKITRNLWKLWYFKYISYWIWSWDFQSEIENHGTLTVSWPLHLIQKGSITKGSQRHLRMLISEKAHTSVGERRGEGGAVLYYTSCWDFVGIKIEIVGMDPNCYRPKPRPTVDGENFDLAHLVYYQTFTHSKSG